MKRMWTLVLGACVAPGLMAQSTAGSSKPAQGTGQSQTQGQTQSQPPAQGNGPAAGAAPSNNGQNPAGASGAAAPSKPTMPQAKTKEEYDAYQAAVAGTDANAADEFASKFPTSDLRGLLYVNMMRKFQAANDAEHTLQMGRKALAIEPNNTWALVTTASVLSERTRTSDLDRDERFAEAMKDAQAAISGIDTGLVLPPNVPPEQAAMVKSVLLSMAHGALGNIALEQNKYPEAQAQLTQAISLNKAPEPDPVAYLRLAIAQDKQNKIQDALANVNKALQYAAQDQQVTAMAQQEKTRLEQLSGAAKK